MLMRVKLPGVAAATSQQEPPGGTGGRSSSRWRTSTLPIYFGLRVVWLELMFPVFSSP